MVAPGKCRAWSAHAGTCRLLHGQMKCEWTHWNRIVKLTITATAQFALYTPQRNCSCTKSRWSLILHSCTFRIRVSDQLTAQHVQCALELIICSLTLALLVPLMMDTHTATATAASYALWQKAINLPTISWLSQHDNALKKAVCLLLQLTNVEVAGREWRIGRHRLPTVLFSHSGSLVSPSSFHFISSHQAASSQREHLFVLLISKQFCSIFALQLPLLVTKTAPYLLGISVKAVLMLLRSSAGLSFFIVSQLSSAASTSLVFEG